jgi:hypothetical protein
MKLITVAGPPSSGKTAVILKALRFLKDDCLRVGVVKFDCLTSADGATFREAGYPVLTGLSGDFCPDHYFITNIEDCAAWGRREQLDLLVSESAGLCNRCAPHIRGFFANGITGLGAGEVSHLWENAPEDAPLTGGRLRFSVPAAVCSYCLGETKIGEDHQHGTVRKIEIGEAVNHG